MSENNVQTFDLDAIDEFMVQEVVDINPDVNPNDAPPPPDDNTWRVKLLPLEGSQVEVRYTQNESETPFIPFQYSGVIIAEGNKNNNRRLFGRDNTLVFDGKSNLAHIIKVARGDDAAARAFVKGLDNYVKLAKAFKDTLAAEPIIKIRTQWQAQRKIEGGGKNGKDKYEIVKSGQKNFPPDGFGGYKHVIYDSKTSTEVSARAVMVDFLPDAAAATA